MPVVKPGAPAAIAVRSAPAPCAHRGPVAVELRERLAHARGVKDPRAERRDEARPDVDVDERAHVQALVLREHGGEVLAAKVVDDAGRDHDVGGLGERERVPRDEPARQALGFGEPARGPDEREVVVRADELDALAERTARRRPAQDVADAAAEVDDAHRARAIGAAHERDHRREQRAHRGADAKLLVQPLQLEVRAHEDAVDRGGVERAVGAGGERVRDAPGGAGQPGEAGERRERFATGRRASVAAS